MITRRMINVWPLLLIPTAVTAAPPASFFERYISAGNVPSRCYARAIMADPSKDQRLARFFLTPASAGSVAPPNFMVDVGFTLKGSPDLFAAEAECAAVGALARCRIGQGKGQFTLSPNGSGLQLQIGNRLSAEGPHGASPNLADGADDMVFILEVSKAAACAAN